MPAWSLRAIFQARLGRLFPEGQHPQVLLIKALFTEIVQYRLAKAQLIGLMQCTADVGANYRFTPQDLAGWPGRVLLLMAEDDPATPEPLRQAMRAMYPQAQARLFSGSGHLTAVLQQEEYFAATDEFLSAAPV
jgi:pimeloyl-ACP methyl ester carboxylesterase